MKITNKKLLHALGKDDTDDDLPTGISQVVSDTTVSGVQWVTGPDPSAPPTAMVHRVAKEPIPVTDNRPKVPDPIMEQVPHSPKPTQSEPAIDTQSVDLEPIPAPRKTPAPLSPPPMPAPIAPQPKIQDTTPIETEDVQTEETDTAQRVRNMFKNLSESKRTYKDRETLPIPKEEPARKAWMPTHDTAPKTNPTEPPDMWETPSAPSTLQARPTPLLRIEASEPSLDTALVDELLTDTDKTQSEPNLPDVWDTVESDKARIARETLSVPDDKKMRNNIENVGQEPNSSPVILNADTVNIREQAVISAPMSTEQVADTPRTAPPPPLDTHFKTAVHTDPHTKANAVFELLQGTSAQVIAEKYGVTTTHLWLWKRIAEEELHTVFKAKSTQEAPGTRAELDMLKRKIDSLHQLLGERDDEIASLKARVQK